MKLYVAIGVLLLLGAALAAPAEQGEEEEDRLIRSFRSHQKKRPQEEDQTEEGAEGEPEATTEHHGCYHFKFFEGCRHGKAVVVAQVELL